MRSATGTGSHSGRLTLESLKNSRPVALGGRMIPAPFEYHRPDSVAAAVKLLATLGDEARVLAGGHSLIPMMKLRLSTPEHLIDLKGIAGLKGVRDEVGKIVIGAMTTQHELLAS